MPTNHRHRVARRHRTSGSLRPASSVSVLVAVAPWVVACGEPRSPVAVGSIPELRVEVGSTESTGLAGYFNDPDGDELSYDASSSNVQVATVAISGDSVAVAGVASGSVEITVTASDGSLSASQDFTASVLLTDRRVLEIVYDELGGDGWADNTNWKTDKPLDEWSGVSTNADGQVDTLKLRYHSLTGEIPSELGDLSNIERLELRDNYLTGAIPPELGDLSNLERLELSRNSLTGEIPSELGDLSSLHTLYLANNSLTGEIPSELGELSSLHTWSLDNNSLTGAIPPELGDLSNLRYLTLDNNSLTGEIPPELGDLSSLQRLDLHANLLTGEIPPELGDLSSLHTLYLADNSLTGEIPSELGDLSSLQRLHLQANLLTGEIPLDFLDLSALEWFYWHRNDGLCAPNTNEFDFWLRRLTDWRGARCD